MQTKDDHEFEIEFKKTLRKTGDLFPMIDSDVESFESNNDVDDVIIPDSLKSSSSILKRGRIEFISKKRTVVPLEIDESTDNFRLAARKGSVIPDQIFKKMMSDRKKIEDDSEIDI